MKDDLQLDTAWCSLVPSLSFCFCLFTFSLKCRIAKMCLSKCEKVKKFTSTFQWMVNGVVAETYLQYVPIRE